MFTVPILLASTIPAAEIAPAPRPAEVSVAEVRIAVERGLPFVEKSSAAWRSERKCVSCHQVPFAVWALTEGKARGFAVDAKKLDDLTGWAFNFCATDENKGERTGGFHLTTAFLILSQTSAGARDDAVEVYPFFETLFAKRQKPDGSWREGRQIRIQGAQREADEVDTMWTLLAIKALERLGDKLPADTRKGLEGERDRGLKFLTGAKPGRRLDWLALRVLVAKEYETPRAKELLRELLAEQNADGGWGYVRGGESYAHTTGEVLYCLGLMGMGENDRAVRKAWKYLVQTQQEEGWWHAPTRETFSTKPDLVRPTSIHWGTAWATIGLMQTLPKK
jgi:squalene-hopene/tetraprenyl-beta-curcumene cyclase